MVFAALLWLLLVRLIRSCLWEHHRDSNRGKCAQQVAQKELRCAAKRARLGLCVSCFVNFFCRSVILVNSQVLFTQLSARTHTAPLIFLFFSSRLLELHGRQISSPSSPHSFSCDTVVYPRSCSAIYATNYVQRSVTLKTAATQRVLALSVSHLLSRFFCLFVFFLPRVDSTWRSALRVARSVRVGGGGVICDLGVLRFAVVVSGLGKICVFLLACGSRRCQRKSARARSWLLSVLICIFWPAERKIRREPDVTACAALLP